MVKNGAREDNFELAVAERQLFRKFLNHGDRQPVLFRQQANRSCAHQMAAVGFKSGHGKSFPCQRVAGNPSTRSYIESPAPGSTQELSDFPPLTALPITSGGFDQRVVVVGVQNQILLVG